MINLLPRDEKFYDQIEQFVTSAADASKQLLEVTRTFPGSDDVREEIQQIERSADRVRQEALDDWTPRS